MSANKKYQLGVTFDVSKSLLCYLSGTVQFHTTSVGFCYLWCQLDFLRQLTPFTTVWLCALHLLVKKQTCFYLLLSDYR